MDEMFADTLPDLVTGDQQPKDGVKELGGLEASSSLETRLGLLYPVSCSDGGNLRGGGGYLGWAGKGYLVRLARDGRLRRALRGCVRPMSAALIGRLVEWSDLQSTQSRLGCGISCTVTVAEQVSSLAKEMYVWKMWHDSPGLYPCGQLDSHGLPSDLSDQGQTSLGVVDSESNSCSGDN
eukprot:CAMPEP_0185780106 /NCGR_PEP_ID=MMETSP1174-20130828/98016_1 /TAXON_ID=35687 /ORGANISM="Dictyocha speculum, Strain CCMP1381" /LENGTH=179 /DNA_ID=CAMNT_0028469521 /DNA_START=199 /DNA_END=738 /DNA_ORIENTATION=-